MNNEHSKTKDTKLWNLYLKNKTKDWQTNAFLHPGIESFNL